MHALILVIAAYLIGAVPSGLVVGRLVGKLDVRQHGSGNIGFTNVVRVVGPVAGAVVLASDIGKGMLGAGLPVLFVQASGPAAEAQWLSVACAFAVIAGHNWPIYLRFRGGKGIAAGAGALIVTMPLVFAVLLAVWGVVTAATRYVSLGSIAAAGAAPVAILLLHPGQVPYLTLGVVGAAAVIYQHRGNIARLAAGTESRLGKKRQTGTTPGSGQDPSPGSDPAAEAGAHGEGVA